VTGILAGLVAVSLGCGAQQTALQPTSTACGKASSKNSKVVSCTAGVVELELGNDSQLKVGKVSLIVDGRRASFGAFQLKDGEHLLSAKVELRGEAWSTPGSTGKQDKAKKGKAKTQVAKAKLRFATATGCRLTVRVVAQDPPGKNLAPEVRFTQTLRCKNGFRSEGSIPRPQPLPDLPAMAIAPLRHWGAQCMQRTNAAQRYVDLAVQAISQHRDQVVSSCLHVKQRRIRDLREMIKTSVNFVKRSSSAELRHDARMTQIACLRVLDLQAEAGKCI